MPWQAEAVVGPPADRVDEIIAQVKDLDEPPALTDGGSQADPQQPAVGSGHHRGKQIHGVAPSDAETRSNNIVAQGSQGEFSARQGLIDRESGISLDGFPSRSVEEGGVSGLFQCESGHASAGSSSPSSTSDTSSGMTAEETVLQTARAVTIRPVQPNLPFKGQAAVHRLPLPAELDRMNELLDDALQFWTDVPTGTVAVTQASGQGEYEVLTGDRESNNPPSNRNPAMRAEGQHGTPSSAAPHHTQGRPPAGRAGEHPTDVEHAQPQPASPTPSDTSITETVFDVRRPTPPPRRTDIASLPGLQRHAVTAAGPSGRLRRGRSYATSGVEQEAVPAVLVPGGGRLGWGGCHPPPQVSRREGGGDRDDQNEDDERRRRRRETRKE